ncbi:MAG: hypothetical protein EOM26_00870 [Alphaproteobacteria bacterium]|nr:hypothetical protein [Alphaproteobacteria bacterium]
MPHSNVSTILGVSILGAVLGTTLIAAAPEKWSPNLSDIFGNRGEKANCTRFYETQREITAKLMYLAYLGQQCASGPGQDSEFLAAKRAKECADEKERTEDELDRARANRTRQYDRIAGASGEYLRHALNCAFTGAQNGAVIQPEDGLPTATRQSIVMDSFAGDDLMRLEARDDVVGISAMCGPPVLGLTAGNRDFACYLKVSLSP